MSNSTTPMTSSPRLYFLDWLRVLAPVWQTVLTAIGMREMYQVSWVRGIIIGFGLVGISFLMFLPFMR